MARVSEYGRGAYREEGDLHCPHRWACLCPGASLTRAYAAHGAPVGVSDQGLEGIDMEQLLDARRRIGAGLAELRAQQRQAPPAQRCEGMDVVDLALGVGAVVANWW